MQAVSVRNERFEALDSWRGICALAVAIFHFSFVMKTEILQNAILSNSYLFVDFFFVLSGFVVCHAYRDRLGSPRKVGGFVLRRFGRLWPLHAVLLFALMLMVMAINLYGRHPDNFTIDEAKGGYSLVALALNTVLLTAMGLYGNAWNSPAWSIGAELYTYLLFAAVVVFAGKRLLGASLALMLGASLVLLAFAPALMNSTADFGFVRCIGGFFGGVATYHVHEATRDRKLPLPSVAEIGVVALAGLFMLLAGDGPDEVHALSLLAPVVFGAAILVFARERGALSKVLQVRPLRALGRWSYSIYMVHMPLLVLLGYAVWLYGDLSAASLQVDTMVEGHVKQLYDLGDPAATHLMMAGFLATVVLAAAWTYRLVEAPWRDRFSRIAKRYENPGRAIALGGRIGPVRPVAVRAERRG
ncbi:acyltransferase [Starkeya sp. ORNL1]|uniref:acyltransferase family protein n=1 Tax=Starkeya sp. ORNL1 TaxID=2709380 RepID=UPI001462A148|nr:acyltransferase [Starkeya sp. ORNL1]QJP13929.1 acyltransferase [Starkeya sp. ORNL1]